MAGKKRIYRHEDAAGITAAGTFHNLDTYGMEHGSLSVQADVGGNAGDDIVVSVYGSNLPPDVRQDGEGENLGSFDATDGLGAVERGGFSWDTKSYKFLYLEVDSVQNTTLQQWAVHVSGSDVRA